MIDKSAVIAALSRHIGEKNGVHVERLVAEVLGTAERDPVAERRVRTIVTELREEGCHICAVPETGYFMAANEQELERYYISFLRSRALKSLLLISRAKNIALPDLLGQLRLPT